ncbi:MAG: class I SAM-dependent methyltransferase [Nitrospira sp.]|nr:class I SAM-dependent methyltransferase [Candidatus Brocadiales bacterium]MBL7048851.1 class I SAM-dependent methyltransferase [Nitrospira sp.]
MTREIKSYDDLSLLEKIFMTLYCYKLPGKEVSSDMSTDGNLRDNPLQNLSGTFGQKFLGQIKDKIVLDVGCGTGEQVVGVALQGAKKAIGVEIRNMQDESKIWASELGVSDRVEFSTISIKELPESSVDIAYCQNSFEHFSDPQTILEDINYVLKKNGKLFISFGPPWLAPYGVHMYFMIKYPWAHVLFSEKTILNVRKLYRSDNANRYGEVEGGLNKMTYRRFKKIVNDSNYDIESEELMPVKGVKILSSLPVIKEFFIAKIAAVLVKK